MSTLPNDEITGPVEVPRTPLERLASQIREHAAAISHAIKDAFQAPVLSADCGAARIEQFSKLIKLVRDVESELTDVKLAIAVEASIRTAKRERFYVTTTDLVSLDALMSATTAGPFFGLDQAIGWLQRNEPARNVLAYEPQRGDIRIIYQKRTELANQPTEE